MLLAGLLGRDNFVMKLNYKAMKKNLGMADRVLRFALAITVVILFMLHIISGTLAITLLVVSGILVLTSLAGFCPIYWIVRIKSIWKTEKTEPEIKNI